MGTKQALNLHFCLAYISYLEQAIRTLVSKGAGSDSYAGILLRQSCT